MVPKSRPWYRWVIPICVGMLMFGNHFARDSVGALEKQLEKTIMTPHQYATLNALYFFPNIITPLVAGSVMDNKSDVGWLYLGAVLIGACGHFIFAYGISSKNIETIYLGRGIGGSMYEIIDALMPIVYLSQYFDTEWGVVVGIMNILLRSGSVFNFLLCPIFYKLYGVESAFWLSAAVNCTAILFMFVSMYTERAWKKLEAERLQEEREDTRDEGSEHDSKGLSIEGGNSNNNVNSNPESRSGKGFADTIADICPLHKLPISFYYYLLSGALLYGSMVPFWFIGSKYLQDYFNVSVAIGDGLLIIPEGMIIFVSLPLGIFLDRNKVSLIGRLMGLAAACFTMAVSYAAIVVAPAFIHGNHLSTVTLLPINNNSSMTTMIGLNKPLVNIAPIRTQSMWEAQNKYQYLDTISERKSTSQGWITSNVQDNSTMPNDSNNNGNNNNSTGSDNNMNNKSGNPVVNNSTSGSDNIPSITNNTNQNSTIGLRSDISISESLVRIIVPGFIVFVLGIGYAFSNSLFWCLVTDICDPSILSFVSGLVSCGVNLLPALVPPCLTYTLGPENLVGTLIALSIMASLGAFFAALSALTRSDKSCIVLFNPLEYFRGTKAPRRKHTDRLGQYELVNRDITDDVVI